jgi:SLOG-like protein
MSAAPIDPLLKPDALSGIRIAISASESPDLLRLGLVETHFRLALAEIARSVLVSGGKLAYGGHLDPDGYTAMLMKELHRYSRRDRPLRIYLAWQEHRKLAKAEFDKQVEDLGLSGEIVCLDLNGKPVAWGNGRGVDPEPVTDEAAWMQALSALRFHMAQNENGRVVIGGKRAGFEGAMPGVMEEAVASVANGQPLYVAGGFGGVAADIAIRMGMLGANWLPALAGAPAPEVGLVAGLDKLSMLAKNKGWPNNGLSDAENAQLAATYRPSEIAALVSLGLGRRFSKPT